jgi:hypothetical protein
MRVANADYDIPPPGAGQTRAMIKTIEMALSGLPPLSRSRVLTATGMVLGLDTKPRRHHKPRPAAPGGLLTAAQAAAKLGCSIKTLNGHVATGAIGYVVIGHGTKRPRKMFTDADLGAFIAAQTRKDSPCPSTASRARHTSTSTFSGTVIDFTAPRKPPTDDKRKR